MLSFFGKTKKIDCLPKEREGMKLEDEGSALAFTVGVWFITETIF